MMHAAHLFAKAHGCIAVVLLLAGLAACSSSNSGVSTQSAATATPVSGQIESSNSSNQSLAAITPTSSAIGRDNALSASAGPLPTVQPTLAPVRGDATAGENIVVNGGGGPVAACAGCHGKNGEGDELQGYPRLAAMQATYVYQQLFAYQRGTRQNLTMQSVASGMTAQQVSDVAAYYAALSAPEIEPVLASQSLLVKGQELYDFGKRLAWDQWMPSCYLCHGRDGSGAGEFFPPIAGQRASYIKQTLLDWQQKKRANDPNGLMATVAAQMTLEEIEAVAAYLNAMPPEPRNIRASAGASR